MDIDNFIIPEEYLIGEGQLVNTEWTVASNTDEKIIELEIVVEYDKLKDNMIECYVRHKYYCQKGLSLLSLIFLTENSCMCKYKICNDLLKINIKNCIVKMFVALFHDNNSVTVIKNNIPQETSMKMKKICYSNDLDTDIEYFYNSINIFMTTYEYEYVDSEYYQSYNESQYCLGFFVWNMNNENLSNDLPIIKYYTHSIGCYVEIEPDKIKKIKVHNNHGFFVQLNMLTLEQICNLHKYNNKLIDIFKSSDWYFIDFYYCIDAVIDFVFIKK